MEKNPAEKAACLLPKKAVYLSCQKRQSTSPAKKGSLHLLPEMAAYPKKKKKKKQEEETEKEEKRSRRRTEIDK